MNINTAVANSYVSPALPVRQSRLQEVNRLLEEQKSSSRGLDARALADYRGYAGSVTGESRASAGDWVAALTGTRTHRAPAMASGRACLTGPRAG